MYSVNELKPWDRESLMLFISDLQDKIFDIKLKRLEGLLMDIPQETRRESYGVVLPDAAARRRVILEILTENGGMTAREVSAELHRRGITPTDERNYAAPRLTELYKAGRIITTGKKLCSQTGRNVAIWEIRR